MNEHFKKLGKHTLIYGISGIIPSLVGLILVPVLTRNFSPSEFGVIELVTAVISFLVVILMLGFDLSIAMFFYKTEDKIERKKIISTGFYFLLAISLIVVVILAFFSNYFSVAIFKEIKYASILFISFFVSFFTLLNSFFSNLIRINLKPYNYFVFVLIRFLLSLSLIIFFIFKTDFGIIGIFYGYLLANIVASILGFCLTIKYYIPYFSYSILKPLLVSGFPLILAGMSGWILHLADRFFIANFMSLKEVGIYSVGVKISQILFLIIGGFQLAWGPFALSIQKEKRANETFSKVLKYFTISTCAIALLITFFSKEIINIISSPYYVDAFIVIGPLSLAMVAYGTYYIVALGVIFAEKTHYIAWTSGIAAILNILLNLILIPFIGFVGAAIATFISYCISAYLLYRASQRYYYIPFNLKETLFIWVLTIIFMTSGILFDCENLILNLIIRLLILFCFFMSIIYFKIIRKEELELANSIMKNIFKKYIFKK